MRDVIITVVGLWVFIKILKVIFGGWSKATTSETGKIQPTESSLCLSFLPSIARDVKVSI
ncbi:hypothetical protein [Hoylesella buccalis]|uniref:hypothetical protein n=1 Tax=Hoylesella buccalis TaxID=28127 RepID=UPI0039940538